MNKYWKKLHELADEIGIQETLEILERVHGLSASAGSAPEVLESSARKWDDNGNRECCAFLLASGEWVLTWLKGSGKDKVQTTVKLSPTAALATMSAMSSVSKKTGKPLGWEPEQNSKD